MSQKDEYFLYLHITWLIIAHKYNWSMSICETVVIQSMKFIGTEGVISR